MNRGRKTKKDKILSAAIAIAMRKNYGDVSAREVASVAETSNGTVYSCFKTMEGLQAAIVRAAIEKGYVKILADAFGRRDPVALAECPETLKQQAISHLHGI